jgi:fluoroacetyl-CoA thioesterase
MPLRPGLQQTEFTVEGALVTDVGGALDHEVLSTPAMIAMMERTAARVLQPHLPPEQATVGFEVCVKHVAGASKDSLCVATAVLTEFVEDHKMRFDVEVRHGERVIGIGTHERRVVPRTGGT